MSYWLWVALRIYAAVNAAAILIITIHGAIRMKNDADKMKNDADEKEN